MKKYYCNDCGGIADECEIITGVTYAADNYRNDGCPQCNSEDIVEIDEREICPVCGSYHSEDDIDEMKICYNEIYSDARGQLYILAHWNLEQYLSMMADLSDEGRDNTIRRILLENLLENGELMDFLRWVSEFDDVRGDINRNWRYMQSLRNGGICEWLDTGTR